MRNAVLLAFVLALLTGCGWFKAKKDETEGWSEEKLYSEAKDRLNSGYYDGARDYYEKLQSRYPFGRYSQQAQIELAYAYYKNDATASAVAACERFIRLYPTNPHVDYAYYLKGLANFNAGKGLTQRYLPADPSQRDQGTALKSFQNFTELVKKFPDSKYVGDAQKRMVYLRNLLARNEVNIANYYMRRGAYVAAANRARYVVENYQGAEAMPDALVVMAKAYRVLEMNDLSNDALRVLEMNFPNYPGIADARNTVVR